MADRVARKKKQQQRKAIVLTVLAVFLCLTWVRNFLSDSSRPAGPASASAKDTGTVAVTEDARPILRIARTDGLTIDPFDLTAHLPVEQIADVTTTPQVVVEQGPDPAAVRKEAFRNLRLQASVVSRQPTAFVNDEWRRVGDVVEGFEITHIGARSITVVRGEVAIEIALQLEE